MALNTVDFIFADEVVLRIAPHEKSRCVLQLGSSSAENAAQICTKFGPEVAAIDLNMGCPKPFSVHAGMGAALLSNQLKVKEILTAMVDASPVPVSAKIRVLDSHDQTMEFVRMVERCGISALAVHGRRRNERPQHKCRTDEIHVICDALTCPVIANGGSQDVRCHEDIERFQELCGASSVMVARKAFTNPSIFRPEGLLSMDEEIRNFLAKACLFDENFTAVKYALQRILGSQQEFDPRGRATVAAGTVREICRIWGMEANFLDCRRKRGLQHPFVSDDQEDDGKATKRPRSAEEDEQIIAGKEQKEENDSSSNGPVAFRLVDGVLTAALSFAPKKLKSGVNGKATPKCEVLQYCRERRLPLPAYQATKRVEDCRFVAVCQVDGKSFSSPVSQPNIKMAEQVAALVALHGLNIRHRLAGDWEEEEDNR